MTNISEGLINMTSLQSTAVTRQQSKQSDVITLDR